MGPEYPQTRSNWATTGNQPGATWRNDVASMQRTLEAGAAIGFGLFVTESPAGTVAITTTGDTDVAGVALISNLAGDYANGQYSADNQVATGYRGCFVALVDPANIPAAGDAATVSIAGNAEDGKITSAAGLTLTSVRIEKVGTDANGNPVAFLYVDGSASLT